MPSEAKYSFVASNTQFFTHEQLMAGGTLELVLENTPNKEWGVK